MWLERYKSNRFDMADTKSDEYMKARQHRRTVTAMMLATIARWIGVMIRMQVESEIWFRAFGDDFGAQARVRSAVESLCGIAAFDLNPLVGGMSDAFGRKRVMMVSPVAMVIIDDGAWRYCHYAGSAHSLIFPG